MPNDAKLGMVVGLGLVIAVAVFFVRKDLPGRSAAAETPRTTVSSEGSARGRPMQQVSGSPAHPSPRKPEGEEEAPGVTVSSPKKPTSDQDP
jgi:hypothetical protein